MKNKFWAVLLVILLVCLSCASCGIGNYYDNDKRNPPTSGDDPSDDPTIDPDDPQKDTHYVVTVYFNNQVYVPDEGTDITVVWRNKSDVYRVTLGEDGRADAGELDGTYNVYLTGLPSEYAYDPNKYVASSNERKVEIILSEISVPESGNGSNMYVNNGCYSVREEGIYRTEISNEGAVLFYEFRPRSSGLYVIQSCVNVYDDFINPEFHLYAGSNQNKWFVRVLDGGGAALDGGFTKNFLYEFAVSANEVGSVCSFALGAVSKTKEYPITVDFQIYYKEPYSSDSSDIRPQTAQQARGKTVERKAGETFVYADMGTFLYDASNFKLNPNTGRYHVYDEEKYADNSYRYGAGYGPMLLCDITNALPSYGVVNSLYDAISVGPNQSNYLRLFNCWIEEEQKFAIFDYTNFIRMDYYGVCNSEGKCYVTEELRTFLQKFAENHSLYTDGVCPGMFTPEEAGYTANQDALWLFACGFYQ